MIDMVFLLLVFFMCVSTMSQADRGPAMDLAESDESRVPPGLSARILLSVVGDETVFAGSRPIRLEELPDILRAEKELRPQLKIVIRARPGTPFHEVRPVLEAAAEAGIADVIYATHEAR